MGIDRCIRHLDARRGKQGSTVEDGTGREGRGAGLTFRLAFNAVEEEAVENPGISYSDILILIPDSRMVYDPIFTLFILLTLSR